LAGSGAVFFSALNAGLMPGSFPMGWTCACAEATSAVSRSAIHRSVVAGLETLVMGALYAQRWALLKFGMALAGMALGTFTCV